MKRKLVTFGFLLVVVGIIAAVICVKYYEFVFSKNISGEILKAEKVPMGQAIISSGSKTPDEQLFSYAVAIKDSGGVIHTASSEDRQWAAVTPGQCAEARFFPYPPWDLESAGTYHGARLIHLFDCAKK